MSEMKIQAREPLPMPPYCDANGMKRIRDLEDTLALRDAATRSLCIAIHGHEIEGKTIYDLIVDADQLRKRAMSASQQ